MSQKEPLFAFFGTPKLSTHVLDALEAHGFLPALIVTAPDARRGRGLELSPTPVKQWALERGIDTATPEKLTDPAFLEELSNTDWDVFVVAAYNKLLPKRVLDIPQRGCLNVHPSLLPKFRGPSPILSAILADERQTGVSVMLMDEQMDAGPIVAQARIEIEETDWPIQGSTLSEMLFTEGGNLLAEVLPEWLAGAVTLEPQKESLATYTKKFVDTDAQVTLVGNPRENFLKIRAFNENPRAHFFTNNGKRVIVTGADMENEELRITRVIPEGKKEMSYEDFLRGQR